MQSKSKGFVKGTVFEHFKPKYHQYHRTFYNSENVMSIGVHGDNPYDKFFNQTQTFNENKLEYSDNHQLALGTTKATKHIPGYQGFIPKNPQKNYSTNEVDCYTNVGKVNHMLNYRLRLPNYGGIQPKNPINIKGEPRPYCLSTQDELFN
jgi:hypothetical protein